MKTINNLCKKYKAPVLPDENGDCSLCGGDCDQFILDQSKLTAQEFNTGGIEQKEIGNIRRDIWKEGGVYHFELFTLMKDDPRKYDKLIDFGSKDTITQARAVKIPKGVTITKY